MVELPNAEKTGNFGGGIRILSTSNRLTCALDWPRSIFDGTVSVVTDSGWALALSPDSIRPASSLGNVASAQVGVSVGGTDG